MSGPRSGLERLFAPTSVAVVGASSSVDKVGHQALLALGSFGGDVFPVNRSGTAIAGRPAVQSLAAIGRPIDLVLFAIPASACVAAVREAIACRAGAGVILGAGFAESGSEGAALQAELQQLCTESGFRLLGPNTAGFVNREVSLTASFLLGAERIPRGSVAVVAQSAGVNLTVGFLLERLGYGVSMAVGLGNAVDVDAAHVLEFLARQPATRAIALHLEGVHDGRRLYETLRRVTPLKPVVALTVGKSDVGEFAKSHTGNLIGSYALRTMALRQAGAVVVESTEELAAAAVVLSRHRLAPNPKPGVGVLTAQAGPGLLMLDRLKSKAVSVPKLDGARVEALRRQLPGAGHLENPVDTGRPSPAFANVLALLAQASELDVIITYALHEPAALKPEELLLPLARRVTTPLLFGTSGPLAETSTTVRALRHAGVVVADSPEQLADAAVVLVEDAAQRARLAQSGSRVAPQMHPPVPTARDEHSVKQLLDSLGVPSPRRVVCASHAEAREALRLLDTPVVVKILSEEVLHKTEVGGVQLGVADEQALTKALAKLDAISLNSPRRYLVEEMAPPGLEVIVGAVRDVSFGSCVMVGLGGTFAEALRDTVTRLAPISHFDAGEMLDELRGARLFGAWRGSVALDRESLERALVSLGDFICACPGVNELEINPLRVYPNGVLALDAVLS